MCCKKAFVLIMINILRRGGSFLINISRDDGFRQASGKDQEIIGEKLFPLLQAFFRQCFFCMHLIQPVFHFLLFFCAWEEFLPILIFSAVAKVLPMPDKSIGKPFRRQYLQLQTLIQDPILLQGVN